MKRLFHHLHNRTQISGQPEIWLKELRARSAKIFLTVNSRRVGYPGRAVPEVCVGNKYESLAMASSTEDRAKLSRLKMTRACIAVDMADRDDLKP